VSLYGTTRVYLARRSRFGTTVYARTGEGSTFGTMPAEVGNTAPDGPTARAAWDRIVRGPGTSDAARHAANVREAVRRTLGLPEGATPEAIDQAAAEQAAHGDQPFAAYLQAFVHVVGDPVRDRTVRR